MKEKEIVETTSAKDVGEYQHFIVCVLPQQKVHRIIKELEQYPDFIKKVFVPKEKIARWVGAEKKEKTRLAMNNYFFVESTDELLSIKPRLESEADCRLQITLWPEGAKEMPTLEETFNNASVVLDIKVDSWVVLPKLGLERVQVIEINHKTEMAKVKAWVMAGCDPVYLDVNIKDMALSKETWEEI